MWNLFSSSSSKYKCPSIGLKEQLLKQQISRLGDIESYLSSLLQALNQCLISVANDPPRAASKHYIGIVDQIECHMLLVLDLLESDQEHYSKSVESRCNDKSNEKLFFRTTMLGYQFTKMRLSKVLEKLQNHIQNLESYGYHIYTDEPKQNNVFNLLTKQTLHGYISLIGEVTKVRQSIEEYCKGRQSLRVRRESVESHGKLHKNVLNSPKLCENVLRKEIIIEEMLTDNIDAARARIATERKKEQILKQAILCLQLDIKCEQIKDSISEDRPICREDLELYLHRVKQTISGAMTPVSSRGRSRSCEPLGSVNPILMLPDEDLQFSQCCRQLLSNPP